MSRTKGGTTTMLQKSLAAALMMAAALPAWAGKDDIAKSVAGLADESWEMAKIIWEYAEPGYLETRSSKLIADSLSTRSSVRLRRCRVSNRLPWIR